MALRQPIVSVLGHVDHGKTTILDKVRGTALAKREPGGVTQHIGATEVPLSTIEKICGPLLGGRKLTIPGLLFIDTPGHQAFVNLRSRGGALADIAVLVIDINEGFKPQTLESLKILRQAKTPFVVALNKVDAVPGWRSHPDEPFVVHFKDQLDQVQETVDNRIYKLIERFHEMDMPTDRYDRVSDFSKTVALVPLSAKTGEGVPDLLLMLSGLAQRYLEESLTVEEGPARGTVLEVKHEKGVGIALDSILVEGVLRRGDTIVIGALEGAIEARVKGLQKPAALQEIRDPKRRFASVEEVTAASGVRIFVPDVEGVIPGAPFRGTTPATLEEAKVEVAQESQIKIELADVGIYIRADAIGSLEGLAYELKAAGVPMKSARVGAVTSKDIMEVATIPDPTMRALLAFTTQVLPDAREALPDQDAHVIEGNVIYKLVEEYLAWREDRKKQTNEDARGEITFPAKVLVLQDHTFRASKPAIVGVRVLAGRLRSGSRLMKNDGKALGPVKSIRTGEETVPEAYPGDEVAIAVEDVTVGRQFDEGDTLYTDLIESEARALKAHELSVDEIACLDEITKIKRKTTRFWGM